MYSNGIMGLNAPMIGLNDVYPGSNQSASEYATSAQTPVSSSAINAGYDPKTDAYSGQMMARGGIASIQHFDDGGPTGGHYVDSGDSRTFVEDPKTESTWTPDQPVKLQSMDQMLAGDASGKDFNPTEHGYEWNGRGFINPNGSTLSVDSNGFVTQALPSLKDYEFNGKYWNPAGENISWNPEKNQTAYKIGGVEVPIERQATKGIAALTDAEGKPRMQMDQNNQPIFTQPEGITQSKLFMDEYGAPFLASLALGGTMAAASGAFGAGTTMANAGAAGPATAGMNLGTNFTGSAYSPAASTAATSSVADPFLNTTTYQSTVPKMVGDATSITPQMGPTYADLGYQGAGAKSTLDAIAAGDAASKAAASTSLLTPTNAARAALGLKFLSSGVGGGSGTQATTQSGTPVTTTSVQSNPMQTTNTAHTAFPAVGASNQNMGLAYTPMTFKYYAQGGVADLGGYAAGGKLLKGPGDGMSDSIVANIGGQQPARLADGEFVIPADVVSHLGNGSTDAGAKHLYKMMDKIRRARTGTPKQGKQINADKFLPRN